MLQSRSAVYKMLQTKADEERRIEKWPPAFRSWTSPNQEEDFDEEVIKACAASAKILRVSKVIVLGDLEVGKTSLVRRFCHKRWEKNYKPTIGVDFELERFDIRGVPFNLQIWDTAGQERFKAIAASYYRGANVIMIVFDLGSLTSLSHCQQWLFEARKSNTGNHFVFLVGTKRDTISSMSYYNVEKRADEVARKMNAEYWAVSAKTDDGVKELFTRIAALSFNTNMMSEIQSQLRYEATKIGADAIKLKRRHEDCEKKDKNFTKWLKCKLN